MRLIWIVFAMMCASVMAVAATVEDVASRGVVTCGVEGASLGFSVLAEGQRQGIAVDLCKIMAAAVLGRPEAVAFVTLTADEAPAALQAEEVDVLLVARPWSFADETEQGLLLVQPLAANAGSGRVFGPVVRQGDDSWFLAWRWLLHTVQRMDGKLWNQGHTAAGERLGFVPGWLSENNFKTGVYSEVLKSFETTLHHLF